MISIDSLMAAASSRRGRIVLVVSAIVLALLLGLGGGFYAGQRPCGQTQQTTEHVTEKVVDNGRAVVVATQKERAAVIEQTAVVEAEHKVVTRSRTTIRQPNGAVEIHAQEVIEDARDRHEEATRVEVRYVDRVVEKVVERRVEVEKVVDRVVKTDDRRNWRASVGLGVSVPSLFPGGGGIPIVADAIRPAVVEVSAERRIVGNFWLGLGADTNGVVAVKASLEF